MKSNIQYYAIWAPLWLHLRDSSVRDKFHDMMFIK